MTNLKGTLGIIVALALIVIGYQFTKRDSDMLVIFGYISICFWSLVLLFAIYKKIKSKK